VPTHKYARRWMNYQMMKGRTLAHCCALYQNKKMMTLIYMWHVHTDEKKNKSNSGMCFHGPTAQHLLKKKQAHPVLKKNGTKNGISRLKTGYRKYGRTNVLPFSVLFPFTPSRFRSRFRLSRKKWKRYTVADETGFIPSVFILAHHSINSYKIRAKRSLPWQ
jgi:hypothetical protein